MGPKGSATDDSWGSFTKAFEMVQLNITARSRLGSIWPLFELFKDKNEDHMTVIRQWLEPLVKRALSSKQRMEGAGISSPIADKTFLEHLADSTEGKPISLLSSPFLIASTPTRPHRNT